MTWFAIRPNVKHDPNGPMAQFLMALPPGFHIVERVTCPTDTITEFVYVFREHR